MATNAGFDKNPQNINKNGAPKKEWTWGNLFKELTEKGKGKKEAKKLMAQAMIKKAKEGDVQAFKEIANRMDGLPKQTIEGDINLYKLKIVRDGEDD